MKQSPGTARSAGAASNAGSNKGGGKGKGSPKAVARQPKITLGPGDPPPYGDTRCGPFYWDARHAATGDVPFDWYMGYDRLASILHQRLPPARDGAEILDVGFGTSEIPACLHADGWTNVTGIDTSVAAVSRARSARRHAGRSELQFLQMDVCKMTFPEPCFHAVIDKALLDTLVCGGHGFPRARDMLSEVYRVLRPGGVYFLITHAGAATRLPYLTMDPKKPWRIEVARLEKSQCAPIEGIADEDPPEDAGAGFFHVFICTKPSPSENLGMFEQGVEAAASPQD